MPLDDQAVEVYKELGEYERHFNRIQSVYRGLAPTWFMASLGGIAFLYSTKFSGYLPVSIETTCALIALAAGTGITLLWLLDVIVYHRLLLAVLKMSEGLENNSQGSLPSLRAQFKANTVQFNARKAISLFYASPTGLLCFVSVIFANRVSLLPVGLALYGATALLLVLGFVLPLLQARPRSCEVFLVCGVPGAGKTTTATYLAAIRDLELLRSDAIRKGIGAGGYYSDQARLAVYQEMLERAAEAIQNGNSVVLDATFERRSMREEAREMAEQQSVPLRLIEVRCPNEEVVAQRFRQREGNDSEAGLATYQRIRETFDPITEPHVIIDNSGTVDELKEWIEKLT